MFIGLPPQHNVVCKRFVNPFSVSLKVGPFDQNRSATRLVGHADGGRSNFRNI